MHRLRSYIKCIGILQQYTSKLKCTDCRHTILYGNSNNNKRSPIWFYYFFSTRIKHVLSSIYIYIYYIVSILEWWKKIVFAAEHHIMVYYAGAATSGHEGRWNYIVNWLWLTDTTSYRCDNGVWTNTQCSYSYLRPVIVNIFFSYRTFYNMEHWRRLRLKYI